MPTFTPTQIAAWTGGQWHYSAPEEIASFNQDTRSLRPGQVFVALSTPKRDGHGFLRDALAAGAAGALVSRLTPDVPLPQLKVADPLLAFQAIAREQRRAFTAPVVGISGSCGKTSTKNLLARLLAPLGAVHATEGNLNNHLGVPLTLQGLDPATHRAAVIEAGISAPGEMEVLGSMIQPDFGVLTLVGPAHLQELGGLDGVAREKARLLHAVRPSGLAVFPAQCWDYAAFRELPVPSLVLVPSHRTCGARWQRTFAVTDEETRTVLELEGARFFLPRVSHGQAQNAALALALAQEMGVPTAALQTALHDWRPSPLRGEIRSVGSLWCYLDCYNANPASVADALDLFTRVAPPGRPRLYLLGGMEELGEGAAQHHRAVGRLVRLRPEDELWVVGPQAAEVAAGARESGALGRIEIADTAGPAAARLREFAGAVLVKGSRRYALEQALPFPVDSH